MPLKPGARDALLPDVLRACAFASGVLVCLTWSTGARADTEAPVDPAGAHALFSEGKELIKQGNVAEACAKFEESYRLRTGIGTLFNLADCWEKLERTASAWAGFLDVAARAKQAGETERERLARERAEALVPRLARLTIRAETALPGLRIERNGVLIGPAMLGIPVPVDPGEHRVTATAPARTPWQKTLSVASGAQVLLDIPPLPDVPSAAAKPRPLTPAARAITTRDAEPAAMSSARTTIGYAFAGAGLAALALGAFLGVRATSKNDEALTKCPGSVCRNEAERREHGALVDDAHESRSFALTSFAAGIGALSGAAVLILTF